MSHLMTNGRPCATGDGHKGHHRSAESIERFARSDKRREWNRRYRKTERYRTKQSRWQRGDKGREAAHRYRKGETYKVRKRKTLKHDNEMSRLRKNRLQREGRCRQCGEISDYGVNCWKCQCKSKGDPSVIRAGKETRLAGLLDELAEVEAEIQRLEGGASG